VDRAVNQELRRIKDKLLAMGGFVERAVEEATQALIQRSHMRLTEVFELEEKINTSQVEVDELCLWLLARQAPVAADLRWVLAVIKINSDLERMGDQAVNIAYNTQDYLKQEPVVPFPELGRMADLVKVMVRKALDAFMRQDLQLAEEVLKSDDDVDILKNQIFRMLQLYIQSHPQHVGPALDLILIARNLERLGDHATNIAEDVIFAFTGEDVRHNLKESK
jgi:phosphate transport system protein